jgi:hypothetical protein
MTRHALDEVLDAMPLKLRAVSLPARHDPSGEPRGITEGCGGCTWLLSWTDPAVWRHVKTNPLCKVHGNSKRREERSGRMSVAERVERGAALLDEKRPGWWREIDLDALDIRSGCDCIAGQLGGYSETILELLPDEEGDEEGEIAHGFDAEASPEFAPLTEAWRDLIQQRRESAQVTP